MELSMTHSGVNLIQLIGPGRSNRTSYKKLEKNNQKIRKVRVRREKFESIPLSSVRLEIRLKFDSFTTSR